MLITVPTERFGGRELAVPRVLLVELMLKELRNQ